MAIGASGPARSSPTESDGRELAPEPLEEVARALLDAKELGGWPTVIVSARPATKRVSTASETR
jgi:hypothetical protein